MKLNRICFNTLLCICIILNKIDSKFLLFNVKKYEDK